MCVCVWGGTCSIWAHVYIPARRSHMKHACALPLICLLRVCLCGKNSLDSVHVLFVCLSPPVYTYMYRTMCQCQLWENIGQPFVFDWQVWPPNCTPSPIIQDTCSEFGVSQHFDLNLFKERMHPSVSVTQRRQCMRHRCLAIDTFPLALLAAQSQTGLCKAGYYSIFLIPVAILWFLYLSLNYIFFQYQF